ncbi:MAG TPA: phosphoribosyltransferase, partial [Myxococcales bacterium]|nr:phosphoribosyltransferase [Myxococcales bacterium]
PQQTEAYRALGYQVTPVTSRPIRDPDAPANLQRPTTTYVLTGGPPLSTFGQLTPQDVGNIYAAANTLPDPRQDFQGYRQQVGATVDATDAMWNGNDLKPGAVAAFSTFVVDRFPPPTPSTFDSLTTFHHGTVAGLRDVAGNDPRAQSELAQALALHSIRPDNAARNINSSEIAAAALEGVTSPQMAADVLHAVGPQNMGRLTSALALEPTGPDDPAFLNSGSRAMAVTSFAQQAAQIPASPPDPAVASFFISTFQSAGSTSFADPRFRAAMGQGLANSFAMGDPALAASEGPRLSALLSTGTMGELLTGATPAQREQIALAALTTPGLTADLLQRHDGNVATALAYAQYDQAATLLTSDLLGGQPRLGPDGQPVIGTAPLPAPPPGLLAQNPAIARLPQPPTAQDIQRAVQAGQLTGPDAARYLRGLAEVTRPIAEADMQAFGASPALTNVIGFFEDMNPFNDPNPLRRSHVDMVAQRQRSALLDLANVVERSSDPAFIAQGLSSGMAADGAYWNVLSPYKDAVNSIHANVQRNRVLTMVGTAVVASVAAPMMLAAGLPAVGATGTIFGMTVTGSPFLSAALPALTTGVLSTTTNAAMQYEQTGQVNWANAVLGGTVDGLTSFYGATVAARAMQQGYGFARTVLPAAGIDAAGGFGSYVLGTPGALQGLLSGDQRTFENALGQAGFSFALSAGVNGAMYRINLGNAAPLGRALDYQQNQAAMAGLLDPANPGSLLRGAQAAPVIGLDGQPANLAGLAGQGHESYFAVYRNRGTGQLQVMEVARSRPGDPLLLQPFDTLQAVRRNNPGTGWEAVGGFHNHPGGTGTSPQDLAMEPLFRGEFGPGFVNYTVGGGRAQPFLNSDTRPLTLQQAYASGYQVPGLAESGALTSQLGPGVNGSLNGVIDNYARPLNAIISDPGLPAEVRQAAQADMVEMYQRFGDVMRHVPSQGSIPQGQQEALNDWLQEIMPRYRPYFDQANSHGYYNPGDQVSTQNSASEQALHFQQVLGSLDNSSTAPFFERLATQGNGTVHVVGLANGGGAPAANLWSQAAQDGFQSPGQFGLLVPVERSNRAASSFSLTVEPRPGDTVVVVDDLYSTGRSAENAIDWLKNRYPDVNFVFVAPGVPPGSHNGVPYHNITDPYVPAAGGGGQ